jgi:hypothetical protein
MLRAYRPAAMIERVAVRRRLPLIDLTRCGTVIADVMPMIMITSISSISVNPRLVFLFFMTRIPDCFHHEGHEEHEGSENKGSQPPSHMSFMLFMV